MSVQVQETWGSKWILPLDSRLDPSIQVSYWNLKIIIFSGWCRIGHDNDAKLTPFTTRKQWSNGQNMSESKRDKLHKIDRFLSLWTNYSQFGHFPSTFCHFGQFSINFFVVYHVLIQTCFCQFDHCFLVVCGVTLNQCKPRIIRTLDNRQK